MTSTLIDTLNSAFGRGKRAKAQPTTKVVATNRGEECEVTKQRGLWRVTVGGRTYINSRLSDLIEQVEENGGSVQRVSA